MKAIFQKLPLSSNLSFVYERYESPYFETPLHYHEEIEIVLCDGGFGKKVIGNNTSEYQEGDVLILGSNLPHLFQADLSFYSKNNYPKPASIVIQFKIESFGKSLFALPEFQKIAELLSFSNFGIQYLGNTREKIKELLKSNINKSGIERFQALIEILKLMAQSNEFLTLSEIEMKGHSHSDSQRMHKIFNYMLNHFKEEINIEHIASINNLSKEAFCRYFKSRTQKTFFSYLIDLRIKHACKLLKETNLTILEICFDSGFNNLSNFNRQFRKIMNCSPFVYRKQYI